MRLFGGPNFKLFVCLLLIFWFWYVFLWGGHRVQAGEHRSTVARAEFMRLHPCPANGNIRGACPGFVVDHIIPLACAGADAPENMQWQTIAEGKEKDKWERKICKR